MNFRIADTFTDSLGRLTGDEQKAVKTTAFDLQMNPASPGLQFHKLDKARDKNFWSLRVSRDIRLIVHRDGAANLLLAYVGHHDDAYQWAERRRLETHPRTGAAQLVEVRERVEEIAVQRYVEVAADRPRKPPLFARHSDDELLGWGVPAEWLEQVRAATEDDLLEIASHLPAEASEALLEVAVGGTPRPAPAPEMGADPFAHPDAQRRFRVVDSVEELERALDYPWEKWTVFLHPAQRETVEKDFGGPARVSGSAGTGKTIVALHRAVFLARQHPDARVLLTTFSETLASALRTKLRRLIGNEPRLGERLEVHAIGAIARRLYERNLGKLRLASADDVRSRLAKASAEVGGHRFTARFFETEWAEVVDAWQLASWPEYRDVARLGRKTRLPEKQRETLWAVFDGVRKGLEAQGLITEAGLYSALAAHLPSVATPPFQFAVVDEAQDVSVAQLRFLASLAGGRPNGLFFAGDLGQRIFQQPFSWKALGVDVRGRSRTLRINYRTSHQIRARADRLLAPEVRDVDGNTEERRGTISVFDGPEPTIHVAQSAEAESTMAGAWIGERVAAGFKPHEIAVFVRTGERLDRARAAVQAAGLTAHELDEHVEPAHGSVSLGTMHLAKGLEFRAVVVMACDDEVVPLQSRIEQVADDSDLEEVYATERHLLYVAATRARDHLLITSTAPASEFLDDLKG